MCDHRYVDRHLNGIPVDWLFIKAILLKKKRDGCALVEHLINNNHQIGWNNVEILQKEQNTNKRLILEM